MAKRTELGTLPPTDPIFQEPWTVVPMRSRRPEQPGKAEEKRPLEEESVGEDAADDGTAEEGQ